MKVSVTWQRRLQHRLKILFLPADNIEPPISRGAYLARGLAKHADVYCVTWEDPRSMQWQGRSPTPANSIKCATKTLFRRYRIFQPDADLAFFRVSCSMLLDAAWHRLVGKVTASRLIRRFNGTVLRKIVDHLKPDVIFYADSFYYFPHVPGKHLTVFDVQDDINWMNLDRKAANYFIRCFHKEFINSNRAYIVSDAAMQSFNRLFPTPIPFVSVPNGADFDQIRSVSAKSVAEYRRRLGLEEKFIISYIGGPSKFSPEFAGELFRCARKRLPWAQFLVVGNIEPFQAENVTWIGPVPPAEAAVYYQLSDMGTVLRDCSNDPFLANSVPLKFVQYAAARKPVLTTQIAWAMNGQFPNIFCPTTNDFDQWCNSIQEIRDDFKWTADMERCWESYSWPSICEFVFNDLRELVASPISRESLQHSC